MSLADCKARRILKREAMNHFVRRALTFWPERSLAARAPEIFSKRRRLGMVSLPQPASPPRRASDGRWLREQRWLGRDSLRWLVPEFGRRAGQVFCSWSRRLP